MRRSLALGATAALALATSDLTFAQNTTTNLQIHWIDTEGGAATLIVTPARESFLSTLDIRMRTATRNEFLPRPKGPA